MCAHRPINAQHTPLWQAQSSSSSSDAAAGARGEQGDAGGGAPGTWGRQGPEQKLGQDSLSEDERWVGGCYGCDCCWLQAQVVVVLLLVLLLLLDTHSDTLAGCMHLGEQSH